MARRTWSTAAGARDRSAPPGGGRRHGAAQPGDRRELERDGWRTTLEYRENHVRDRDGRLRRMEVEWRAEAEREAPSGGSIVIWACGSTPDKVWSRLRLQADLAAAERSAGGSAGGHAAGSAGRHAGGHAGPDRAGSRPSAGRPARRPIPRTVRPPGPAPAGRGVGPVAAG